MTIDTVIVTPLTKAFKKFETFRLNQSSEQEKAGTIQAFEYTFELCWKTMQKLLKERGIIANSPKETFRLAALEGFIDDPVLWFEFLKKRNLTVHTYEEDDAAEVLLVLESFSHEVKVFFKKIGINEDF